MARLSIREVSKSYGNVKAVDAVSLEVEDSELIALLGPSGCGKTTLLRMIAGFLQTSGGRIFIGEEEVTHRPPHKRNTGMVFQSYALFPHMTMRENVAFGLRMRGVAEQEIGSRVADALRLVHLEGMADRYPRELSGGQQQRVAVARALVIRPDVFLLDEPLSNLDAKLRHSVGQELRSLQQSLGLTTVFVTHDQSEALALADRLVLMEGGRIVQSGSASALYSRPVNAFVANFLGQTNLLPGRVESETSFLADGGLPIACDTRPFDSGARAILCLRPENIVLGREAGLLPNRFHGQVEVATYLGATSEITLRLPNGTSLLVHRQNRDGTGEALEARAACDLGWLPSSSRLLKEV